MKKNLLFISIFFVSLMSFAQQDTIVGWTFPSSELSDTVANIKNDENSNSFINTDGGVSAITMKNGATTKAAQATNWDNGADAKSWLIRFSTAGFTNIQLSSKQTAGDANPGPKNFRAEFKVGDSGTWTIFASDIVVQNDWASGVLENVILPEDCNNQNLVYVRWIMTDNLDIYGADVLSTGTAKIDDIIITGNSITEVKENANLQVSVYPNPCTEILIIESENEISEVAIFDYFGRLIQKNKIMGNLIKIDVSNFQEGSYIIVVDGVAIDKIVIK